MWKEEFEQFQQKQSKKKQKTDMNEHRKIRTEVYNKSNSILIEDNTSFVSDRQFLQSGSERKRNTTIRQFYSRNDIK